MQYIISDELGDQILSLLEELAGRVDVRKEPSVMTIGQASERWGISEENLRRLCVEGEIKAFKVGKQWRIPRLENEVSYVGKK